MNIVKKSALVTGALAAALMVGCVSNKPLNTVGRLTLDTAHSNLSAVAIKNEKVPVDVKFPGLSGWAEASGQAELTIPISSLDTGNPERDTNIKDLFFEVAKKAAFGSASFKLDKIETDLSTLKSGQIVTAKGSGSLSLHGASLDLSGLLTFARKGPGLESYLRGIVNDEQINGPARLIDLCFEPPVFPLFLGDVDVLTQLPFKRPFSDYVLGSVFAKLRPFYRMRIWGIK